MADATPTADKPESLRAWLLGLQAEGLASILDTFAREEGCLDFRSWYERRFEQIGPRSPIRIIVSPTKAYQPLDRSQDLYAEVEVAREEGHKRGRWVPALSVIVESLVF